MKFFERNEKTIIFAAESPGSCEARPDGVVACQGAADGRKLAPNRVSGGRVGTEVRDILKAFTRRLVLDSKESGKFQSLSGMRQQ